MFKIGEKVVCIKPIDELIKHQIYTVKNIYQVAIQLVEYNNEGDFPLIYYYFWRFKKLDYEFVKEVCNMIEEDNLVELKTIKP